MRVLIFSDVHATNANPPAGGEVSYVNFSKPSRTPNFDPLTGLASLINDGRIDPPDIILCAGDLGDRADAAAIAKTWSELSEIKQKNGIEAIVATCGNHDLDSRHAENKFDPRGYLRALEPPFPFPGLDRNAEAQLMYWADNFAVIEGENWRLLNINSCAYHGYGPDAEPELEHGRISDHTMEKIRVAISDAVSQRSHKTNICLVHHHLKDISSDIFEDTSMMKGATRLIEMLSQATMGEWMVVHGHRHRSDLYLASGSNSAPLVLACASFSATRKGDENNPCPNQFYMLEFDQLDAGEDARIRGKLQTWNWTPSIGWQNSNNIPGGLPIKAGFGFRGDIPAAVAEVFDSVKAEKRLTEEDLYNKFPHLQYLMPSDLDNFITLIERKEELVVTKDGSGSISEIVWRL